MKCHYEILEVSKNAELEEIKASYRALALKLHPDKNGGSAEANERFKALQASWEVLRNPQERAWYDSHREQILRANNPNDEVQDSEEINLFHYFAPNCYQGYEDTEDGFFRVYKGCFDMIGMAEKNACEDDKFYYPEFGDRNTSFQVLKAFYQYWSNFVTVRTFSWKDKWNLAEAPSRDHRRAMEKENKKERETFRKEYIAEVKSLVDFVRRRDIRWEEYKLHLQEEESRKKEVVMEKRKLEADRRAEQLRQWHQTGMDTKDEEENVSEEEVCLEEDIYSCLACNKIFKSEKQLKNHEKSKKHRDQMEIFKVSMKIGVEKDIVNDVADEIDQLDVKESPKIHLKTKAQRKRDKEKAKEDNEGFDLLLYVFDAEIELAEEVIDDDVVKKKKSKSKKMPGIDLVEEVNEDDVVQPKGKKKKSKKVNDEEVNADEITSDQDVIMKKKKSKSKKSKVISEFDSEEIVEVNEIEVDSFLEPIDSDDSEPTVSLSIKKKKTKKTASSKHDEVSESETTENPKKEVKDKSVDSKKKSKKSVKSVELSDEEEVIVEPEEVKKKKSKKIPVVPVLDPLVCQGCNSAFSSKTKLFDHLKNYPKHAALK